jgi:hypothetical protein
MVPAIRVNLSVIWQEKVACEEKITSWEIAARSGYDERIEAGWIAERG